MLTGEQQKEFKELDEFVTGLKKDQKDRKQIIEKLEKLVTQYLVSRKCELEWDEISRSLVQVETDLYNKGILDLCLEGKFIAYEEMGDGIIYFSISPLTGGRKVFEQSINFKS